MRTESELEHMAKQLNNLYKLPADEWGRRFLEVCGDLTGYEVEQLAAICGRLADDQ